MTSSWQLLKADVKKTAEKAGRNPNDIEIVAVTKGRSLLEIEPIYREGARIFGESKLQESVEKVEKLPQDAVWHFIGPLQKNKLRKILQLFTMIHSVASLELAKKIDEISLELGIRAQILLQVNISLEATKQGFLVEELLGCFKEIAALKNLNVCGLMTMAPLTDNQALIRSTFRGLFNLKEQLFGKLSPQHLSMGMSNDYRIAIEEGATLLRIGSLLWPSTL